MTAAVLAVGLSAAGVKTLDIVPAPGYEPGSAAGAQQTGPGSLPQQTLAEQARPDRTEVDSSPVTPKVREIKVSGIASRADAGRSSTATATPAPTAKPTPSKQAPQQEQKQDQADPSQATKRVVAQSAPQKVRGYATVGVTWKHGVDYTEDQIGVQVRTEKDGRWSGWMTAAYHDEHGPDAGTAEEESSRERPGTDALVIGSVDQVQMRAETTDGKAPTDLKLAVIDPGKGSLVKEAPAIDTAKIAPSSSSTKTQPQGDADQPQASGDLTVQTDDGPDQIALSAMKKAAKPTIYSRAQWGANERMRDQSAPSYGTVKAGFIHHTVNANNYSASQVPSLLRGIYAYHTQSRGWRDIGYNYLVDRFGRIWEGRYGGVTRAVVGAHTLGYNEVSFAMSDIGNFDITRPPAAVLTAYARLFAWKLSLYNIRADAPRVYVKNRYLHAINGHRDVGQTACPGRYLYAQIPYVRTLAQRIQNAAQSGGGTTTPTPPKPAPAPTPATPPKLFHTPTQMPQKWTTQSTRIVYPKATNIAGSSYPDLALKRADGRIVIQPTGGQAGFKAPVTTTGGWKSMDLVAAVGDVTGDGKGDVLARLRSGGTTRVYAGDGAGHVTTRGIGTTTAFRTARSIMTAGDWNRDKRPDVLMRDKYSRLWMVPGAGGGRFGRPVLLSKSWGGFSSTSVPGDLTGDGRPDVVAIHHTGYLYLVPSTSRHTLGTPVRLSKVGSTYDSVVGGARDLTGDSDPDVVIRSSRSGKVAIVAGSRKARLGSTYAWTTAAASLRQLSASQVAGSAQADLVGVSGDKLVVLPHNGLSNLRPARASNLTVSDATQVLSVGSWNGDKYGDVITRVAGGDVLMLHRGQGNGNFVRRVKMSGGWRSITSLAAVGDVTGDRNPDLAGKTASGQMRIFPGNGKNGFLAPRTAPAMMKTFNTLGTGSWRPLVAGSRFTSSDGSFVPYVGTTGRNPAGYDWVIGPGDVNGDGRSDLVTRDGAGSLWLLPGTSTAYAEPRLLGTGFGGYRLGG
ncbi:MAG: FG-GAP-like repeat-containing protein [Marmoricola sp.]